MVRKKGQTKRLTEQHKLSGGVVGIFGEEAQQHDVSVYNVAKFVYEDLQEKYTKYKFRLRKSIPKSEINKKLNSLDNRLGKVLIVEKASIKPDGGLIEVKDKEDKWRVILVSEAKYQGKDVENIRADVLVGKNKNQMLMVAGNAIERVHKNINEIRNFMLDEHHFPYVVFLQGSNFATETIQVYKLNGEFVDIRHNAGSLNRIDRVSAANYCMPINCNYCKNIFVSHKKSSIMLQAASIYARCDSWIESEMRDIMLNVAETSMSVLNQLG